MLNDELLEAKNNYNYCFNKYNLYKKLFYNKRTSIEKKKLINEELITLDIRMEYYKMVYSDLLKLK